MGEVVRGAWLTGVVRECQLLAGQSLPLRHTPLAAVFSRFLDALPPPQSHVERVILRGLLVELCLRWGDGEHRAYHNDDPRRGCGFIPSEIVWRVWNRRSEDPRVLFEQWASEYIAAFETAHPLYRAAELRHHLELHFARSLRIDALARERGLSPRRLQRDFITLTGTSVQEYVTKLRVDAAVQLLKTTDDKVESIARDVGWSSRKNLNRAIMRFYGLSPASIRADRRPPDDRAEGTTASRECT
jgi:AraC-like DNA-binding protein